MTVEGERNVFYTTVSLEWHHPAAGAAVSVIAGVITLFLDNSQSAAPTTIQSPLWATFWSLAFVGIVLILLGLPALYPREAGGRGRRTKWSNTMRWRIGCDLQEAGRCTRMRLRNRRNW